MDSRDDTFFGLHFEPLGESEGSHDLPAHTLVQALDGLQRTIHLVAMMTEKQEIKTRVRVPRDVEKRYQLHCQVPVPGSYCQPTYIAPRESQHSLSGDELARTASAVRDILRSMGREDDEAFKQAIPDSAYRAPIIASLTRMLDAGGAGSRLAVQDKAGNQMLDSATATSSLERIRQARLAPDAHSPDTHSVATGHLSKIDFKASKIFLVMPGTGHSISCLYDQSIEATLLENARDLIQVVGTIELDENGHARRITDVQEVHAVNTDDIDLADLLPDHLELREPSSFEISVKLSEDRQTYLAEFDALDIREAAYTRSDLISALKVEIDFLWNDIAQVEDDGLAPDARLLKEEVRKFFKETS